MRDMRKYIPFSFYLFLCLTAFPNQPFLWILDSNRSLNMIILDAILAEDEEYTRHMLKTLVKRSDLFMEDIIEGLFYQHSTDGKNNRSLEVMLESVLAEGEDDEFALHWMTENSCAYEMLVKNLSFFTNPYLKAHILTLLPYFEKPDSKSYLMVAGEQLLKTIEMQSGFLLPGQVNELSAFFEVVIYFKDRDFLEICVSIIERTKQKEVVRHGKKIIKKLLYLVNGGAF